MTRRIFNVSNEAGELEVKSSSLVCLDVTFP